MGWDGMMPSTPVALGGSTRSRLRQPGNGNSPWAVLRVGTRAECVRHLARQRPGSPPGLGAMEERWSYPRSPLVLGVNICPSRRHMPGHPHRHVKSRSCGSRLTDKACTMTEICDMSNGPWDASEGPIDGARASTSSQPLLSRDMKYGERPSSPALLPRVQSLGVEPTKEASAADATIGTANPAPCQPPVRVPRPIGAQLDCTGAL